MIIFGRVSRLTRGPILPDRTESTVMCVPGSLHDDWLPGTPLGIRHTTQATRHHKAHAMIILGRVSKLTLGPPIPDFSEHKIICIPGAAYRLPGCRTNPLLHALSLRRG